MAGLSRRDFLKIVGVTGSTAVIGCSSKVAEESLLIPYFFPPEDIIPGEAVWYATTCRECPAGCGVLAKNREGRVVKLEGNPLHPVNRGKLCARGQAAVQGLYNPDRIKQPLLKNQNGTSEPIAWEQAEALLVEKLQQTKKAGRGKEIVFLSSLITGSLRDLIVRWLANAGSDKLLIYEPLAHEPLRTANQLVFGLDSIPTYRLDTADFLISFGADFLETWISPVEYARQFASFHAPRDTAKNLFIFVGPRQSLTAVNADHWVCVPSGTEYLVALGMLRVMLEEPRSMRLSEGQKALLLSIVKDFSLETIAAQTGVSLQMFKILAQQFSGAQRPLALAGSAGLYPTAAGVAANLLCSIIPGSREAIDFAHPSAISQVMGAGELKALRQQMLQGDVQVLLLHNANPIFSSPPAWEIDKAIAAVPFVVSFSSTLDETSRHARLILPTLTPLESWGDYAPRTGTTGLMQPVMGSLFNARQPGDILISSGKKLGSPEQFPWPDYYHLLKDSWQKSGHTRPGSSPQEKFWDESMQQGGVWETEEFKPEALPWKFSGFSFPAPGSAAGKKPAGLQLMAYPTIQFFDGRSANRPWLQELPDPLTMITWGSWLEIHPETAHMLGIKQGDVLQIQAAHGSIEVPAYLYHGIHPDTLAMPVGQGHTAYGRFADNQPGSPVQLLASDLEKPSGALLWTIPGVMLTKTGREITFANTDGSPYQHDRGFARSIDWKLYQDLRREGRPPDIRMPLPDGFNHKDDFYPPHQHVDYRWCMVVDLDRCIGCGACAIACSAENNVAVVGRDEVARGREMSWLRIERYFEPGAPAVRFFPMLCQHCDEAPCESVCPVFAPQHSPEGINNQVFNRCIGTRFCSQNCPYKVRRFNWYTYKHPEPLNWQLNPDVTVREKGVMEKCSFCIQRIKEAKNVAQNEGRKLKDGEVTPACAQTCPADALVFGSILDPGSRVSQLLKEARAYQALDYLNTKPAVIYLKKVINTLKV
jgi:molybdopterin-containing oxidoreductase family iron-sulfur binding subunit